METMTTEEALKQFEPAAYKYAHQWHRYISVAEEFELEDLAQIARMYIIHAVNDYDPTAGMKFSTYVIQRIRWGLNTALRSIMPRQKRYGRCYSIDAMTEDHGDKWHPFYWAEQEETFEDLIKPLNSTYQRVLTLRFMEGLTLEQIGTQEGKSHEWARITIQKATEQLQEHDGAMPSLKG
jgi:RNA polymerase sigma factor (sigma-70 family)